MARKKKNAGVVPLTSPQTREEHYLANIAGLVGTKPEYPFTRTERYLDVISGSTSGLSDRVTALEIGKLDTLGKGGNLLINAYFYQPVNQRAIPIDTWISATDPETYNFIDRWKLTSGRAKLTSAGVVLEGTMIQILEFYPHGNVVASALTTDGYVTPVYNSETKTFTITATGETLVAAKLELGTVQTLYSGTTLLDTVPNYQQELAKCQRYLQIIKGGQNAFVLGSGFMNTKTEVRFTVPLTVPMAAINQIVEDSSIVFNVGGTWVTTGISSVHIMNQQDSELYMSATLPSDMTQFAIVVACLDFSKTLLFSAE